jgi:PKD repeat protein
MKQRLVCCLKIRSIDPSIKKTTYMKRMNKILPAVLMITSISLMLSSCEYDVKELGPKPDASFTITPVIGQVNKYLLTSTSTNSFRYDWDKATGAGYVQGKQYDSVYFADAGTYTLKLLAYGQSGMDSAIQNLTVAADDPAALTPYKMLTGNNSRKWKLAPEAGALFIGPSDFSQTWWANGLGDLTTRSCLFNDEYTFIKAGNVLTYDSKGDFYVDEEGGVPHPAGMPAVGCYPNSAIPAQFQAWANSGKFHIRSNR